MNVFRRVWEWFTLTPTYKFDSVPRPIDRMIFDMMHATGRVARTEALSVPAVLRGRNMICGSVATLPLTQYGPDWREVPLPLLDQIDPDVANSVTIAQTLEDLLFEGLSWWRVIARGFDQYPTYARHLDFGTVSLQPPDGQSPAPLPGGYDPRGAVVYVDGEPVPARDVIRFDSLNPPLLVAGGRAIRRALLLDRMAELYANNPRPLDLLMPDPDADEVDDEEGQAIADTFMAARKRNSTSWLPKSIKYQPVDSPTPQQMQLVELQKQCTLEIANAIGIDPEDLGISTTSRTYFNAVDRKQSKINDVLMPYMKAITDRLSMGDVTKRGYCIQFDPDDYLRADPATRAQVQATYLDKGVTTVDEVRAEERLPALTAAQRRAIEPPDNNVTPIEQARHMRSATFGSARHTFEGVIRVANFSVNREERTIEGLALPYGEVANGFRFEPGALQFSAPSRVKLLRDHDYRQALGVMVESEDSDGGVAVKYKVARGADGDTALSLAEDGVLDGFSVGVDFDLAADTVPDPENKGVTLVRRADWRETSLTAMPAFDNARVTKVAASRDQGVKMDPEETSVAAPPAPDLNAMFAQFMATQNQPAEGPTFVNPTRPTVTASVTEAAPYRFDRRTGTLQRGSHEFSSDVFAALRGDEVAHQRVIEFAKQHIEFVVTTDVDELNPTRQRPDMYVDQRSFDYPMWDAINKGTLTDITPFTFPKFSSAGTLVAAHVEGVEPSLGTFVTTSQTVTPVAVSGKIKLTRETIDQGGNPQVSNLIWRQMLKAWYEALEAKAALVLTANAASITDVTLTTGGGTTGQTAATETERAFTDLQYVRGGFSMDTMFTQIDYFRVLAAAKDGQGRPLYPRLGPTNANGQVQARFRALDVAGVVMYPAWALAASGTVAASSFLFDREVVHGWASAPQRLDITQTEVANVYIGLFGYTATAISDFSGVREFIYDPV